MVERTLQDSDHQNFHTNEGHKIVFFFFFGGGVRGARASLWDQLERLSARALVLHSAKSLSVLRQVQA